MSDVCGVIIFILLRKYLLFARQTAIDDTWTFAESSKFSKKFPRVIKKLQFRFPY